MPMFSAVEGCHHQCVGMVSAWGCRQGTNWVPYRCDQMETQLSLPPMIPPGPVSGKGGVGEGESELTGEMHKIQRCRKEERKFQTKMKVISKNALNQWWNVQDCQGKDPSCSIQGARWKSSRRQGWVRGMLLDAIGLCSVLREPARVLGC